MHAPGTSNCKRILVEPIEMDKESFDRDVRTDDVDFEVTCSNINVRFITYDCLIENCDGLIYDYLEEFGECRKCRMFYRIRGDKTSREHDDPPKIGRIPVNDPECPKEDCPGSMVKERNHSECNVCGLIKLNRDEQQPDRLPIDYRDYGEPEGPKSRRVVDQIPRLEHMDGLSNHQSKLVSPFLSTYTYDSRLGDAILWNEVSDNAYLDSAVIGAFDYTVPSYELNRPDFGRDSLASAYLSSTLNKIKRYNNGEETLIPIVVDGDGNCLLHAISKALVGHQLYWHALSVNMLRLLNDSNEPYKKLFEDFFSNEEWSLIIKECDPFYEPPEKEMGLRNIHSFIIANAIKRPIILFDSEEGMKSAGDYSAIFLPSMCEIEECKNSKGQLRAPICIAWSSPSRNHFVPLICLRGKNTLIHKSDLPRVWGIDESFKDLYIDFQNNYCLVGTERAADLDEIHKTVRCVSREFFSGYNLDPSILVQFNHYLYSHSEHSILPDRSQVEACLKKIFEGKLYKCYVCGYVKVNDHVSSSILEEHGSMYEEARYYYKEMDQYFYYFYHQDIFCKYNQLLDELVPQIDLNQRYHRCKYCQMHTMRKVFQNGVVKPIDGDRTRTKNSKCSCGRKHYWDGMEYSHYPKIFQIYIRNEGKIVNDIIVWHGDDEDDTINSIGFRVASKLIRKHFSTSDSDLRPLLNEIIGSILKHVDTMDWDCGSASVSFIYAKRTPNIIKCVPPPNLLPADLQRQWLVQFQDDGNISQEENVEVSEKDEEASTSESAKKKDFEQQISDIHEEVMSEPASHFMGGLMVHVSKMHNYIGSHIQEMMENENKEEGNDDSKKDDGNVESSGNDNNQQRGSDSSEVTDAQKNESQSSENNQISSSHSAGNNSKITSGETTGSGKNNKQLTPEKGRQQATPEKGRQQATPEKGRQQATPEKGRQQATPEKGRQKATPEKGRQQATPEKGRQQATPEKGRQKATPEKGRQQASSENDGQQSSKEKNNKTTANKDRQDPESNNPNSSNSPKNCTKTKVAATKKSPTKNSSKSQSPLKNELADDALKVTPDKKSENSDKKGSPSSPIKSTKSPRKESKGGKSKNSKNNQSPKKNVKDAAKDRISGEQAGSDQEVSPKKVQKLDETNPSLEKKSPSILELCLMKGPLNKPTDASTSQEESSPKKIPKKEIEKKPKRDSYPELRRRLNEPVKETDSANNQSK